MNHNDGSVVVNRCCCAVCETSVDIYCRVITRVSPLPNETNASSAAHSCCGEHATHTHPSLMKASLLVLPLAAPPTCAFVVPCNLRAGATAAAPVRRLHAAADSDSGAGLVFDDQVCVPFAFLIRPSIRVICLAAAFAMVARSLLARHMHTAYKLKGAFNSLSMLALPSSIRDRIPMRSSPSSTSGWTRHTTCLNIREHS